MHSHLKDVMPGTRHPRQVAVRSVLANMIVHPTELLSGVETKMVSSIVVMLSHSRQKPLSEVMFPSLGNKSCQVVTAKSMEKKLLQVISYGHT